MNIQTKAAKHSAPGQYLGFALQPVRLFYHLLTCPKGAKVSLEFLDDVAVHYTDGSLLLEQTKSALKQNPISDWAADLWKAFDNWLAMLKAGECATGSTRFRLYVAPVRKGDFASALAAASTAAEVAAVVETVRKKLGKLKGAPGCVGQPEHLTRRVTTVVDAYQSEVNAENVKMAMAGNAERGFWNGSIPPFGYRTIVVARMAKKDKKKLAIDEAEAEIVRLIFDLYLERCGNHGKSGVIAITRELNGRNLLIRGKPFRTGTVHDILHRTTYSGTHYYNRTDSRTGRERPRDEWIPVDVPAIIGEEDFQRVQAKLAAHQPRVTPARTVNSPTLTAGLAKCGAAGCGAGMLLRTGKSGRYRYLICERKRTFGADACASHPVQMPLIDDIVLTTLEQQVLAPDRLKMLLEAVLDRSDAALAERREALKARRAEKTRIQGQKMRLLELVELGELSARDPQLTERLQAHNARLAAVEVEIRSLEQQLAQPRREITPGILDRFSMLVRKGLRHEDPTLRRAYLRLVVDEVVVTEETVLVRGSKSALEHAVFAGTDAREGVLTSIQEWRARQDSNLRPQA